MTHQPAISSSISFQTLFNRAGGRTSNVRQKPRFMCNAARYTLLLFLVIGSSCAPPSPSSIVASRHRSGAQDSDAFPNFWQSFRAALKTNDVSAIIWMTKFPLEGGLETSADFTGVNTQEGFKRHFGRLFPEAGIRTLLTTVPDFDGRQPDAHDVRMEWSISHTTTTTLSEGEWTDSAIIYGFSRRGDGSIKLTSITIAG
jgi:hypothetical protein